MKRLTILLLALLLEALGVIQSSPQRKLEAQSNEAAEMSFYLSNLSALQAQQLAETPYSSPASMQQPYDEYQEMEEIIDMIGSTCSDNSMCDGSTFCCSKGRCVPGSICYKGQKQAHDHCDYGFECLSRCCSSNTCSPVINCVETCVVNSDCANEPCCSFGYCTGSASICANGMKEDFDQCEAATECQSERCTNGRCTSNEIYVSNQLSLNILIILVFLMLIIVVTTCYFAKIKNDQLENLSHYRRQRGDSSQEGDSRGRRIHRENRRGDSSSSERHKRRSHRSSRSPNDHSSDDFYQRRSKRHSRGLADNIDQPGSETLNKENLERLSRQANSQQPNALKNVPRRYSQGSGENRSAEPALLFVEDDQEVINQYGSSFINSTNPRTSDLNRAQEREAKLTEDSAAISQDFATERSALEVGLVVREKAD